MVDPVGLEASLRRFFTFNRQKGLMTFMHIPFNQPYLTGQELGRIEKAHANGKLSGNGPFTQQCQAWLEKNLGCKKAFLTHSGTAALEMTALLMDLKPGDEVIMPSYTFVSTANAFVLRGAVPVFVDIRPDTLNLDEKLIEAAVTSRTQAVVPVHYAGVGCDMAAIGKTASKHHLRVVEDAAHGMIASFRNKALGSLGHMAALSFHETKNIISGEGGALLLNDPSLIERAEILWEKGTNRKKFFRGEVDKYTWVDLGSSFLPSEMTAAFLSAQMEKATEITNRRLQLWERYHQAFAPLEKQGKVRRPVIPEGCVHNAHMYYLLLETGKKRDSFLEDLNQKYDVNAVFHYIPLHDSPAGRRYGRVQGTLPHTINLSQRIARLPLWVGLETQQDYVIESVQKALS
jgi:dTDP-4-amino-4,6-dideoxygalactose transaminase